MFLLKLHMRSELFFLSIFVFRQSTIMITPIFENLKQILFLCQTASDLNEYNLFQIFRNISHVITIVTITMQTTTLFLVVLTQTQV
jgi:hypothetical protein